MSFSASLSLLYAKSPTFDPTENDFGGTHRVKVLGSKVLVDRCPRVPPPIEIKAKYLLVLSNRCPTPTRQYSLNLSFYLTLKVFSIPPYLF